MSFESENPYTYSARIEQITTCIPDAFDYKKYFYIGAFKGRTSFLEFLTDAEVTILEIFPPYAKSMEEEYPDYRVICNDVRNVDQLLSADEVEVTIWFHGPEHVKFYELPSILKKLDLVTSDLIVLGCPFGIYEQAHDGVNVHGEHSSHLYPKDFRCVGYNVSTLGEKDRPLSNLLAWKFNE